jgi:hypothetical protein
MLWRNVTPPSSGQKSKLSVKKSGMDTGRGMARIGALSEPIGVNRI